MGLRAVGLGVGLALAMATAATAGLERTPQTGSPAMVVNAPDGWTVTRDDSGNLFVIQPDRRGVVVLIVEAAEPSVTLDQFVDTAFGVAKCARLARTEPATVGGRSGRAFFCTPTQTELLPLRTSLVRLDSGHIAAVSKMVRADASAAVSQQLDEVIASVRFEGAAP